MSRKHILITVLASAALALGACGGLEENELLDEDSELLDEGKADAVSRVQVTTDKDQYSSTDPIVATVRNTYKWTSIYLPGCNATGLQQQTAGGWKDLGPEKLCFWEGFAVKVAAGSALDDNHQPRPAGTYRVRVDYRTGCKKQQTFSQCKGKVRTAYSASFTVGQPGACASSAECAPEEYCHFPAGACLSATTNLMTGTCTPRPQYCYALYKPVCGCDGKTYGNDCQAAAAGASVASAGQCACGKSSCAAGQTCCSGMPFPQPTCVTGNICPISKREHKTDIHYLQPAELQQLRDALLKFRLASYRYRQAGPASPKHLGFIIDDVAPSPSVEASGERVNLYGYATMAVAAVQLQAKQIQALERELKQLRAELRRRSR